MGAYERVRYAPEGGRARTVYLVDVSEVTMLGEPHLTGVQVDREGDEVAPPGVDEVRLFVTLSLVTRRTPVAFDRLTGLLEASR